MILVASVKSQAGIANHHDQLSGWRDGQSDSLTAPVEISLAADGAAQAGSVRLALDPTAATLAASASGGSQHYFRLADATLHPLPAEAALTFARGDAYIAVSPG